MLKHNLRSYKSRYQILRKRSDFVALRDKTKVVGRYLIIQARITEMDGLADDKESQLQPTTRVGITVTRKIGKANVRNRIRRRVREGLRQLPLNLFFANHDYVFIVRKKAITAEFAMLTSEISYLIRRVNNKI